MSGALEASRRVHRLLIDGGTTNTRAWAVEGDTILAHGRAMVGARDSARDGSSVRLANAVHDLLTRVSADARREQPDWQPECVVAAGMITSPLGLAEVPHVPAPAGVAELAAQTRCLVLPEVTPLPLLFVPGVRCGPTEPDETTVSQIDVMRGEEIVCVGLAAARVVQPPAIVLSVGSHWKLCEMDQDGRVAASTTTLSGELLHVLRTQTVLAASVEADMPDRLDLDAVRAGVAEQQRAGFPRAVFCTRLLDRVPTSSPRARLAFLVGIVVGETLTHWRTRLADRTVALVGAAPLCDAWLDTLTRANLRGLVVSEAEAATGFIAGLTAVAERVSEETRSGGRF
jgi:2-dehydro-3-deoxygalactonokinase